MLSQLVPTLRVRRQVPLQRLLPAELQLRPAPVPTVQPRPRRQEPQSKQLQAARSF